jgi:hypothetical protein
MVAVLTTGSGDSLVLLPDSPSRALRRLVDAPRGVTLGGVAIRADGGEIAFVASGGPGLDLVAAFDLASGAIRTLTPFPGFSDGRTAYSSHGRLLFAWSPSTSFLALAEQPIGSGRVVVLPSASGSLRILGL